MIQNLLLSRRTVENLSVLPAATAIATLDKQIAGLEGMGLVISNALAEAD